MPVMAVMDATDATDALLPSKNISFFVFLFSEG
jgi:hypothetical protein